MPAVIRPSRSESRAARRRRGGRRGYSLVELLVVIGIIALLIGVLVPVISKARRAARSAKCLSNLRQIAVAFHVYAGDNEGKLPDPNAVGQSWEAVLSNYLKVSEIYRCPADDEVYPAVGSSYDWRDTGDPDTTLAGCPLSDAKARNAVLVFDALPHWHQQGKMNVAWTDTSAGSVDVQDGLEDLMQPVTTNRAGKGKGKGKGKGNGHGNGNGG